MARILRTTQPKNRKGFARMTTFGFSEQYEGFRDPDCQQCCEGTHPCTTHVDKVQWALDDFKVGDILLITCRYMSLETVEETRVAVVHHVNYNGNGLVGYGPPRHSHGKTLSCGQGSFDPKKVGSKPFGFAVAVEKTGRRELAFQPFTPRPGNTAYDLMC